MSQRLDNTSQIIVLLGCMCSLTGTVNDNNENDNNENDNIENNL